MRQLSYALVIAAASSAVACTESEVPTQTSGTRPPVELVKKSSRIVIDGTMGKGEWGGASMLPFVTSAPEGLVPATLFVSIDATNLYLAVRIQRPVGTDAVFVAFQFDTDNDGVPFETGDDAIWIDGTSGGTGFVDNFRLGTNFSTDVLGGGTSDGAAAIGGDLSTTVVEIRHPLNSGDSGHDIALTAATSEVGINFDIQIGFPGLTTALTFGEHTTTTVPSPGFFCKLNIGPPLSIGSCPTGRVASVRITPSVGDVAITPLSVGVGLTHQLGWSTYDYLGTDVTAVTACGWASNDLAIATVSQAAVVTGVAIGNTVIFNACATSTPVSDFGTEGQLRVNVIPVN